MIQMKHGDIAKNPLEEYESMCLSNGRIVTSIDDCDSADSCKMELSEMSLVAIVSVVSVVSIVSFA